MFTNEDRVHDIDADVKGFARRMGLHPEIDADGPVCVAGDMICNILHWVERRAGSREAALEAMRSGLGHYVTESSIDYSQSEVDELGPESRVEITIDCDGATWRTETWGATEIIGGKAS